MFDQVLDNMRKATESSLSMQQELFRKWVGLWPAGFTPQGAWADQVKRAQKQWTDLVNETMKRQRELLDAQFKAGLQSLDEAFKIGEAKNPEELRARTVEFWRKSLDCLRDSFEKQAKEYQAALEKWTEAVTRTPA